jgi:hypothetical protein
MRYVVHPDLGHGPAVGAGAVAHAHFVTMVFGVAGEHHHDSGIADCGGDGPDDHYEADCHHDHYGPDDHYEATVAVGPVADCDVHRAANEKVEPGDAVAAAAALAGVVVVSVAAAPGRAAAVAVVIVAVADYAAARAMAAVAAAVAEGSAESWETLDGFAGFGFADGCCGFDGCVLGAQHGQPWYQPWYEHPGPHHRGHHHCERANAVAVAAPAAAMAVFAELAVLVDRSMPLAHSAEVALAGGAGGAVDCSAVHTEELLQSLCVSLGF